MVSVQAQQVMAQEFSVRDGRKLSLATTRSQWTADAAAEVLPAGTTVEAVDLGGVAAEKVRHPDASGEGGFLLLHGGGYVAGNCVTHRKLAAYLSQATGMAVYVPDYRLAPENPFPAAVEDALAAYCGLLDLGVPPAQLVVGGDSAGGGLGAALLLALRDKGLTLPKCGVLMSPWTDILCRGQSYIDNKAIDPSIDPDELRAAGREYAGDADPEHHWLSPIGAELAGLPPLLIHVGELETMLDDSTVFAQSAADAGVEVTLEVWPGLWHVWHGSVPDVPEAVDAIRVIGGFVRTRVY